VQPVIKPVVAVAGDMVELGPEAVIVNGQRVPGSSSAAVDSLGRPLPHAVWGRHVVAADEFWVVSTRVPNSWDSRYLGPFSRAQVRAVAWPIWTVD
jgi:conjugative transfer signal peptidase TraF